jgi:cytoplasmic iron level regulating protein YaaA (DUF328/UPF0246 family)
MLVLLPPSEGKTGRRRGRPVDLDGLHLPELTEARRHVLERLAEVSATPGGPRALGVSESLRPELERNTRWHREPAVPAATLYSGVLYDALGLASLPPGARRRATARLVVVSAAWGALRLDDKVPPYRLSMATSLPGLGPLAGFWRPRLERALTPLATELVVDCRSSTYAAAWRPSGAVAERTVTVRVLREHAGRRTVVSHMAKHTRGLVARHLVSREGRDPRTAAALASAVGELFEVELSGPARDGSHRLDVVVSQ